MTQDKLFLLQLFRKVAFAETEDDLDDATDELFSNPVSLKYPNFLKHLKDDTFPKINSWSIAKRSFLPISSNHTNNLVEASFR